MDVIHRRPTLGSLRIRSVLGMVFFGMPIIMAKVSSARPVYEEVQRFPAAVTTSFSYYYQGLQSWDLGVPVLPGFQAGPDGTLYAPVPHDGANGKVIRIRADGSLSTILSVSGTEVTTFLLKDRAGVLYAVTNNNLFRIEGANASTHMTFSYPVPGVVRMDDIRPVMAEDGSLWGHRFPRCPGEYGCRDQDFEIGDNQLFHIEPNGNVIMTGVAGFFPRAAGSDGRIYLAGSAGGIFAALPASVSDLDTVTDNPEANFLPWLSIGNGQFYAFTGWTTTQSFRLIDTVNGNASSVSASWPRWGNVYQMPALHPSGTLYFSSYKIDAAGNFSLLQPAASGPILIAQDGRAYYEGYFPTDANRTIVRLDTADAPTAMDSFPTETRLTGSLAEGPDCAICGTYSNANDDLVVYRVFESGELCQRIHFDAMADRTLDPTPFSVDATATSGLPVTLQASGSCAVIGSQVTLTGIGTCTLTAAQEGDDRWGPADEVSQSFQVLFDFLGFLPPVAEAPALNRVNVGRVVPVAFEIAGDPGPDVLEGARVRRVDCDTLAPEGGYEPASSPGASGLRSAGGRYAFPWKADRSWTGTCRELALPLIDGSVQRAYFSFESRPLPAARRSARPVDPGRPVGTSF